LKKLSALIVILALFAVSTSYAQPALTIHVTGGYSLPLPDLKGTWPDDNTKTDMVLFQKSGYNVGADGKYYFDKKLRSVGVTLSLAYMGFSSGDLTNFPDSGMGGTIKINSFTVGLGVEYKFLTKKKAQPFIGAEFTGNFLSGKMTPTTGTEYTMKSTSRFGLAFGAGVDINASKNVGVVVGLKYALLNLIGKKDTSDVAGTNEFALWDKAYGDRTAASYSYMQFYAGVSFYLMQPKKMMKK
jgi:outer membrane protein W